MGSSGCSATSPSAAGTSTTSCRGSCWPSRPAAPRWSRAARTLERWLAIPFGIGAALTLDESALLLELEDVYWTEEGILSVQVTLAVIGLLGALEIVRRMLQRGEQRVL